MSLLSAKAEVAMQSQQLWGCLEQASHWQERASAAGVKIDFSNLTRADTLKKGTRALVEAAFGSGDDETTMQFGTEVLLHDTSKLESVLRINEIRFGTIVLHPEFSYKIMQRRKSNLSVVQAELTLGVVMNAAAILKIGRGKVGELNQTLTDLVVPKVA